MTAPVHALAGWKRILGEIRRAPGLGLFSDFDGTLVRLRKHPRQVRLPGRMRERLMALSRQVRVVGIVSGRGIADLRRRAKVPHVWYAGAHGFYLMTPGNREISLLTRGERATMRRVRRSLAGALAGLRGVRLEPKEATLAVHYRAASSKTAARARQVIEGVIEEHEGVSLMAGKKVWELLPNSHTDKWTAISYILRHSRKGPAGGRILPIFLGDDVTDERVFRKMEGISVAVGKKHKTAARYYLRSPAEVAKFLDRVRQAAG